RARSSPLPLWTAVVAYAVGSVVMPAQALVVAILLSIGVGVFSHKKKAGRCCGGPVNLRTWTPDMETGYLLAVIFAMGAVTFGLRALPLLSAHWLGRSPVLQHLGRFLPLAMMGLQLAHSPGGGVSERAGGPSPELLALARPG